MAARDPVVLKAISNVEGRQSSDEWWAVPPRQRTEAIYAELRRLDAETVRQRHIGQRQPADKRLVYAVA